MKRSSFSFSLATWIACFAIVLATLAPSISRVVAAERIAQAAAEQCHAGACDAQAHPHAASASAEGKAPRQSGLHVQHCPFCSTTAASFALMPTGVALLLGEQGQQAAPLAPPLPMVAAASHTPIQPRGPPSGMPRLS